MRLLTTYNLQLTTRRKAFTLMEILIAASIFAIVMVIATGILGQSSSFRSKIKEQRNVSENAKMLADKITRDVRESAYPAKIVICNITTCGSPITEDFNSGIAMIHGVGVNASNQVFGNFVNNDTGPTIKYAQNAWGTQGQILITTTKDLYKVYWSSVTDYAVYYKEYPRLDADGSLLTLDSVKIGSVLGPVGGYAVANRITDNSKLHIDTFFSGFAPSDDATVKQQAYVQFYLICRTKGDYASLPPNSKAKIEIRSAVTARSFAD